MFPADDHADSPDEWMELAERWANIASAAYKNLGSESEVWSIAGFVCECLLKGLAMKRLGLNSWPSRDACKMQNYQALYTHDLRAIAALAGLNVSAHDLIAPRWKIVLQWRRYHMYASGKSMSEAVKRDLIEAAIGSNGVAEWLKKQIR